ncbi:MAG: CpsD/CapB family tyrosine-protein kinase [Candidatus Omnitrophica bacterium]|nr:CpsD/CapB family tyrosine-protein kinase [Candidatus Omnitrophota bacterium]
MDKGSIKFNINYLLDLIAKPSLPYVVKSRPTQYGIDPRVVSISDPKGYICEQYRKVVTNLEFNAQAKALKVFLVTSAGRFEGKSVSSSNIAALLSTYENKKVLLIDCDLRKPSIHRLFNLPRAPGVGNIFMENIDPAKVMNSIKESPMLNVITAGSNIASPVKLFSSAAFKNFIANLKSQFEYIIVDTPPVIAVTDSCVIANIVDGAIVVVSANVTPEYVVKKTMSLLEDVKANVVGLLLTHTRQEASSYYGRYYKYYKYYMDVPDNRQDDK